MEPVPVLLSREISADFNSVGKNKSIISQLTLGQKLFLPPPASPAWGATEMQKVDEVGGGANRSGGTVETAMDNSNVEREKRGGNESGMEINGRGLLCCGGHEV